ncbi:hypothetical protein [Clostridium kluyveri]|uniref:Uncharacterized protein n=1 Tax=Clostridium kluyveri TaxID=1534 RepID=A0A1L5F8X5_CLOKL|nr:hypothetical protein [Clostridium kluyveri]APM39423.1 hypothetical protein BS101_12055 [Clostridium kluyveri]
MRRLTPEKEQFFMQNFHKMKNKELAKILNISKTSISRKARQLGLKPKLTMSNTAKEIETYKSGNDTLLEIEGRRKTAAIPKIKDLIPDNKVLNIKEFINKKVGYVPTMGKVIGKTQHLIVIQTKNYTETFRIEDIYTGKTIVREIL